MKKRKYRKLLNEKKGDGSDTLYPTIIRTIVYIVFFGLISFFVYKSAMGALVYEQAYAKDIGLLLDKARLGTTITYDVSKGIGIAKENEVLASNIVHVNSDEGYVDVRLSSHGGYRYYFFTNYDVESRIDETTKKLTLIINEK
ncbi:hypothetical protein COU57_03745 [Candidatus Pacearchaeota archaeon CG10_big_fil_rev_8_21_14_0_10_32_14]|nr:MAG: hypothetical protein COU57_03745 [Candidatus Pacearchaeota archaeon CG10_big_fil_rev_8_21_14_0_10_32_14]